MKRWKTINKADFAAGHEGARDFRVDIVTEAPECALMCANVPIEHASQIVTSHNAEVQKFEDSIRAACEEPIAKISSNFKTRYFLGPFEDPNDPPRVLMDCRMAQEVLGAAFADAEVGDEIRFKIVEMTAAEVDALPDM